MFTKVTALTALRLRRFGITALVALIAAGVVVASAGAKLSGDWVHFRTEDGNIECVGNASGLECVMHSSGYDPTAPDDTNHHPDWVLLAHGVALKGTTPRGLGGPNPPFVLRDSKTLTVGNTFRCSAIRSHLTCISRRSRHGFFLSQGRQRTF